MLLKCINIKERIYVHRSFNVRVGFQGYRTKKFARKK